MPPSSPDVPILELDEVFIADARSAFVERKNNQVRIWVALDRATRQVVSY
ncbi:MAG: hypothetical protein AAF624_04405 [Bacteroidota bacterium]